jgi:hypothetical protein
MTVEDYGNSRRSLTPLPIIVSYIFPEIGCHGGSMVAVHQQSLCTYINIYLKNLLVFPTLSEFLREFRTEHH